MRSVIIISALLIFTACQPAPEEQAPAINEGGPKPVPAVASLQPGEWESRIDSIHVKFEPVETPQGRLDLDDTNPSPPPPYKLCVTEDKAKQLFKPYRTGGAAGESCTQASFTMKEGRIHGILVCTVQGEKSERQLEGRYTPTSYEATEVTRTRITTPPGDGLEPTKVPMTSTRKMTARRIGDCPAG